MRRFRGTSSLYHEDMHVRRGVAVVVLALGLGLAGCTGQGGPGVSTTGPGSGSPGGTTTVPTTPPVPTTLRDLPGAARVAIGTAINADLLRDPTYSALAAAQFNSVTAENAMKWERIEPVRGTYIWTQADQLVAFAQANGQTVRGHTLIWHNQVPSWLATTAAGLSDAEFAALVKQHVLDEVTHFKGRIWQWDVVNEAYDDSGKLRDTIFRQRLGDDYLALIFGWAREADPGALLFYNDYGMEYGGAKTNAVLSMVQDFQKRGIPIDGVGFQAHYEASAPVPTSLPAVLKRFTDLGLKVAFTEMDVRGAAVDKKYGGAPDKTAQFYTTTLGACLGAAACLSFTVWGISDKDSWVPYAFPGQLSACLYDGKYQPNPWYADVAAALG